MSARKHGFTAEVTERDWNNRATRWRGRSYEEIEDSWRRHVHDETGRVPTPHGDKANRWSPPVSA